MVEAQVEDLVYPICRSVERVCHYCMFDLLIEIYFPIQFMCILNMNIESMDAFNCLYMVDYICQNSSNTHTHTHTHIYIMLALFVVVERKL